MVKKIIARVAVILLFGLAFGWQVLRYQELAQENADLRAHLQYQHQPYGMHDGVDHRFRIKR